MNTPYSVVNDAEQQLADHFQEILIQAMNEFNGVEIVEKNTLDFSEPYKDWQPSAVKDTYMQSGLINLVPDKMQLFERKTTKMLTSIINKEQ